MSQLSNGHVFMSYSRRDDVVMRRVVAFLRKQGIKVWVDNEKLIPGTPIWEEEIEKAIKNAPAVVVVASPDSKKSEWVRREISLADQYKRRVFPVLVRGDEEDSITIRLVGRQYVDIRNDEDAGLSSMSASLLLYLEGMKIQEQLAENERIEREKVETENRLREAKEETNRIAIQRAEKERLLHENVEMERKATEEAERLVAKIAKEKRITFEKAETERLTKEKRLATQKAEEEQLRREKIKVEQKNEAERKTTEKAKLLAEQKDEKNFKSPEINISDSPQEFVTGNNLGFLVKRIFRSIPPRKEWSRSFYVGILSLFASMVLCFLGYNSYTSFQSVKKSSTQTAVAISTSTALAQSVKTANAKSTSAALAQSAQTASAKSTSTAVFQSTQTKRAQQTNTASAKTAIARSTQTANAQATTLASDFFDGFDDNRNLWVSSIDNDYLTGSIGISILGELFWKASTVKTAFTQSIGYSNSPYVHDFFVSVDAKRVSGTQGNVCYGVSFRESLDSKYLFLVCDDQRYEVSYFDGKIWNTLIPFTKSTAIEVPYSRTYGKLKPPPTPAWNTLAIDAHGNEFTFYINGTEVARKSDSHLTDGTIRLAINMSDLIPAQVSFDNFHIIKK